ncbi:MAG: TIR domain-containing protein [Candidatus Competibacteraceae bacterium]
MPSLRETLLQSKIQELQEQRSRLTRVLEALQKQADFETRADEKLRQQARLEQIRAERQAVDAELLEKERELQANSPASPATPTGNSWHDRDINPGAKLAGRADKSLSSHRPLKSPLDIEDQDNIKKMISSIVHSENDRHALLDHILGVNDHPLKNNIEHGGNAETFALNLMRKFYNLGEVEPGGKHSFFVLLERLKEHSGIGFDRRNLIDSLLKKYFGYNKTNEVLQNPSASPVVSAANPVAGPLDLFYCYARKDGAMLDQLKVFLKPLQREGLIKTWHDRDISPGTEWSPQIDKNLESARIILLLVSPDFMASDYIWDIELKRAMERHAAGSARVIPIILRETEWSNAPFSKLVPLPEGGKPVTFWGSYDEAFTDIVRGIRKVVHELTLL